MSKAFLRAIKWPLPRRFECTACGACCRFPGLLLLFPQDVQDLAEGLGISVGEFVAEFCDSVEIEFVFTDQTILEWGLYLKKKLRSYECIFLEGDSCTVHSFKPSICRQSPISLMVFGDYSSWISFKHLCPGVGRGSLINRSEVEASLRMDYRLLTEYPRTPKMFAQRLSTDKALFPRVRTLTRRVSLTYDEFRKRNGW